MKSLLVVVLLAQTASAQPDLVLPYRVKKGDTLELIAAEFYGDRGRAQFILTENKLRNRNAFTPGDRLRIPVAREITTAKGDTFESLASTYLGDPKRAPFLADFNNLPLDDSLATGTAIAIPAHVTHVATGNETLAQIATSYLGDAKQAAIIQRYNFSDKTQLEKGDTVIVPDLVTHARASKLPPPEPDAKQRRDEQQKARASAAAAIPRAQSAWAQGDFGAVKAALEPLANQLDYLDSAVALECGLLLGKAHVAFGDVDAATKVFAAVLDRRPRQVLSPYAESPKVIAAWKKAGGHVEGE